MADKAGNPERGSHHATFSTHSGESVAAMDATDEERRVIALANELRISSAISPRELLSLQCNSPLESDDDISPAEDEEEAEGGERAVSREGEDVGGGGSSDSSAIATAESSSSASASNPPEVALASVPAPVRRRRRRPRGIDNDNDGDGDTRDKRQTISSASSSSNCGGGGIGTATRGYSLSGGHGLGGVLDTLSSPSGDDDTDSWARSRSDGGGGRGGGDSGGGGRGFGVEGGGSAGYPLRGGRGSARGVSNRNASLRFVGGLGGVNGSGGGRDRGMFSEDTGSSSSATLSLQLPFSEDEAALMSVLGQKFHLAAHRGGGGGGGMGAGGGVVGMRATDALGLAAGQTVGLLEGLPGEAVKARVLQLEEEMAHLERCRGGLEGELRSEKTRHETQVQDLEKRWLEQIAGLKKGEELLETERDKLEARLRDKREMYKDLAISDALARELRRVPEEEQTTKEYVSLKAYDLVASSKGELERTRRELEKTQEQLLATTEAAELQRREDVRARRLATAREEGLKVDLEALKDRAEDMSGRAREAQRLADENRDKARRFDEVEALLNATRLELDAARTLSKSQAEALVDVAASEKAAARDSQDATQRSAMLELDKTYLHRELTEAQGRADRLGRECEAGTERLRELERAKETLAAELLSVRERTRSEHEERLEAEVGRLREQSAKELADIRISGREVFERENGALRESRQDALQECLRLRSELSELQRAHEDLVMAVAKSDAAHETATGEVRSELRLKSFELSQLGVAHAEKCSCLRQAELELEMLREQVTVHRGEFAELEASTSRKISELQLLLTGERDKVRAFEDLELEVDGAVMRTGREILLAEDNGQAIRHNDQSRGGGEGGDPKSAGVASGVDAASTGGGVLGSSVGVSAGGGSAAAAAVVAGVEVIPIAPHRRLRQAVLLAHKLLKKEGELEASQRELAELQQRAKVLETRASKAEGLLESVEQPTKYMVDSIRSKDVEIDALRSAQRRLLAKTEGLERECREAAEEKVSLEDSLKLLAGSAERARRARGRSRGFDDPREAEADYEAGGAPAMAPSSFGRGIGQSKMPSGPLSDRLTVYGGRRVGEGGPRWYSYRQTDALRVPSP
eukprot:jgi/Undpi1/13664/HiC_scaffold_9.g03318.m1